ncbi:hypothetical protein HID58_060002, partial [Brassica napus]
EVLKSTTVKMAEESKVLNTPGADKQTEQKLFDALRQELELYSSHLSYFDITFLAIWELVLEEDGLGKEINETVEHVFCRLCGLEPPLFSSSNMENKMEKETETI